MESITTINPYIINNFFISLLLLQLFITI